MNVSLGAGASGSKPTLTTAAKYGEPWRLVMFTKSEKFLREPAGTRSRVGSALPAASSSGATMARRVFTVQAVPSPRLPVPQTARGQIAHLGLCGSRASEAGTVPSLV